MGVLNSFRANYSKGFGFNLGASRPVGKVGRKLGGGGLGLIVISAVVVPGRRDRK